MPSICQNPTCNNAVHDDANLCVSCNDDLAEETAKIAADEEIDPILGDTPVFDRPREHERSAIETLREEAIPQPGRAIKALELVRRHIRREYAMAALTGLLADKRRSEGIELFYKGKGMSDPAELGREIVTIQTELAFWYADAMMKLETKETV